MSFGNWGKKETWKICNFDPKASEPFSNIDISNVAYCTKGLDKRETQVFNVKRNSMRNALVPGRRSRKFHFETITEPVLREEQNWTAVMNLLKWSEVLQTEGFRFNSW